MLNSGTIGNIKIAKQEYENALKSRVAVEVKKTTLVNLLINSLPDIIDTCYEAEELMGMLMDERSKVASLEKKIADADAKVKKAKNG